MMRGPGPSTQHRRGSKIVLCLDNGSVIGYPKQLGVEGCSKVSELPVRLSVEQAYQVGRLQDGALERMQRLIQDMRQLTPEIPHTATAGKRTATSSCEPSARRHKVEEPASQQAGHKHSQQNDAVGKGPSVSQTDDLFESSPSTSYGHYEVPCEELLAAPQGLGRGKGLAGAGQGKGKGFMGEANCTLPTLAGDDWDAIEAFEDAPVSALQEHRQEDEQAEWSPGALQRPNGRKRVVMMSSDDEEDKEPPPKRRGGSDQAALQNTRDGTQSQAAVAEHPAPASKAPPAAVKPRAAPQTTKPPMPAPTPASHPSAPSAKPVAPTPLPPASSSPPSRPATGRTNKMVKDSPRDFSKPSPQRPSGGSGGKHRYINLNGNAAAVPKQQPASSPAPASAPSKPVAAPAPPQAPAHAPAKLASSSPLKQLGSGQLLKSDDFIEVCKDIIKKLKKHLNRRYWVFERKPDERDCPQYYSIIKQPMYMALVEERLRKRMYRTAAEFATDVRLVWSNCSTYNLPDTEVYRLGVKACARFEELWEQSGLEEGAPAKASAAPVAHPKQAPAPDRRPAAPGARAAVAPPASHPTHPATQPVPKPPAASTGAKPAPAARKPAQQQAAAPRAATQAGPAATQRSAPASAANTHAPAAATRAPAATQQKEAGLASAATAAPKAGVAKRPREEQPAAALPVAKAAKKAAPPPAVPAVFDHAALEAINAKIEQLASDPVREEAYNEIMEIIQQDEYFKDITDEEQEVELDLDVLSYETLKKVEAKLR